MYFCAPIPPVTEGESETKEKRLHNKERDPNDHYLALCVLPEHIHMAIRLKFSSREKCLSTCLLPPPPPRPPCRQCFAGRYSRKDNVRQGYFNIYSKCVGPRLGVLSCPYIFVYLEYHSVSLLFRIGTPIPSPANECVPPPGWGHTRLRVRGSGGPNSDDWRKSLALCLLCDLFTPQFNDEST